MLPKDQISTSGPYGRREITSGDIQYGVPTNDFLLGNSCDTCAQKPKSDNFTCNKTPLIMMQNFNTMCWLHGEKRYQIKTIELSLSKSYMHVMMVLHPMSSEYREPIYGI